MANYRNPNKEYWQNRFEMLMVDNIKSCDKFEKKELQRIFERAKRDIQKEISHFYARWAKENKITMQEAIQNLQGDDYKTWRMDIKDYVDRISATGDKALQKELDGLALRSRISRLDELEAAINVRLSELSKDQQDKLTDFLSTTIQNNYYKTLFTLQVGVGVGTTFAIIDDKAIHTILNYNWSGELYSKRIWKNTDKLATVVKEELTNAFVRGASYREVAKNIADKMDASYSNAVRLARTEMAFVANDSTLKSYNEFGVEKYQFLATLDNRTSQTCRAHDLKVYEVSAASTGSNYPPLHARCRSTTTPYYDDASIGERIARDAKGKTYYVPADMDYKTWHKTYVS